MFQLISRLNKVIDHLEKIGRDDLAETLDKIADRIVEAYKHRIKRQRRARGVTKVRRRQYYKRNRAKIRRKHKIYRRKTRIPRRRRRRLKHYKRFG